MTAEPVESLGGVRDAFERLVSLENGHDAGRITDEVYETTRVALIEGLAALDAARAAVPLAP